MRSNVPVRPWIAVLCALAVIGVVTVALSRAGPPGPPTDVALGDEPGTDRHLEADPWISSTGGSPDGAADGETPTATVEDPGTLRVWAQPELPAGFESDVAAIPEVTSVVTSRRGLVGLRASWDAEGSPVDDLDAGLLVPMQAVAIEADDPDLLPDLAALTSGEIALSATGARLRGLGPGGELDLDGHRLAIVAVVPDEVAGASEVLLASADAERFNIVQRSVTIRHTGDEESVREAIAALVPPGVSPRIRSPRDDRAGPIVRSQVEMKERFGEFAHGPVRADGGFTQDPAWVEEHITSARVPILGTITCHRDFIPLVAGALGELEDAGLSHLIDPSQYEGCWAPRRIASGRTISKHAWGVAIDLNASTNAYGETPALDTRVVEIFERWGMRWGGDFLVPDGMHFEWYEDPA